MLGGVASKFLMKYLKEYIEDIDSKHIDMQLWKGNASFQDLVLRKQAFSKHNIPVKVEKGILRKIDVCFPWKNLSTEQTKISISNVFVLVRPDGDVLIKKDIQASGEAFHVGTSEQVKSEKDEKTTLNNIFNTIIDNLEINVSNIHIRLEYEIEEGNMISCGVLIPSLNLFTVNEKGERVQKLAKREAILSKKLEVNSISAYFDTTQDSIDLKNFKQQMLDEITQEHQFVLNPFSVKGSFIHNRQPDAEFKTIINIIAQNLHFSIDLMQCRSIIPLNTQWRRFNLHRKYAHISKPADTDDYEKMFSFISKCAISKARPNQFNPKLALTILKNRKQYAALVKEKRQNKTAAAFKNLFGKSELEKLEKTLGSEAIIYLRQYAEIVISKQVMAEERQNSGIDLSVLKGIANSEEAINFESLDAHFMISNVKLEMDYFTNMPLFRLIFSDINGHTSCSKGALTQSLRMKKIITYYFNPNNTNCTFKNEEGVVLFNSEDLNIVYDLPEFENPSFKLTMKPIYASLDTISVKYAIEFFAENKKAETQNIVSITDVGEQLQFFRKLRKTKCNILIPNISLSLPYVIEGAEKQLKFVVDNISFNKESQNATDKLQFDCSTSLTLKEVRVDEDSLITDMLIKAKPSLVFYECSFNVDVEAPVEVTNTRFNISKQTFFSLNKAFEYIIGYINAKAGSKNKQESTISLAKLRGNISVDISDFAANMMYKEMLRSTAKVDGLQVNYAINQGIKGVKLIAANAYQYGTKILDLANTKIDFKDQLIDANIPNTFLVFDCDYFDWILEMVGVFSSNKKQKVQKKEEKKAQMLINLTNPYIELAYDEDDNIILTSEAINVDMSDEKMKVDINKIKANHYEREFLSEFSCNLSLLTTKEGKNIDLNFPFIALSLDTDEFHAIMDTLTWCQKLTDSPSEEPVSKSSMNFNISFNDGLALNGFNRTQKIFSTQIPSLSIVGQTGEDSLKVRISLSKIDADYYEPVKMLLVDDLVIDFESQQSKSNVGITMNAKELNFNYYLYSWIMGLKGKAESTKEKSKGQMSVNLNQKENCPIKVSLIDNWKEALDVLVGGLSFSCALSEAMSLEVCLKKIDVTTKRLPGIKVAEVPEINVHLENDGVDVKLDERTTITSTIPYISELLDIAKNTFSNPEEESNDLALGFGVKIPSLCFHLLTLEQRNSIDLYVDDVVCALKATQKLACVSIDSIKIFNIYTQYNIQKKEQLLDIHPITLLLSFREDEQFLPLETIIKEPHIASPEPINLSVFNSLISIGAINIMYTHQFAQNLLDCIPFTEKKQEDTNLDLSLDDSSTPTPSSSASSSVLSSPIKLSNKKPKSKMIIDELNLTFFLFDPLAKFQLTKINAQLDTNWSANINGFLALNKEGKSLITCPTDGKEFFHFEMKGEKFYVKLRETNLFFDYSYWLQLASFILRSPFFRKRIKKAEDGNSETISPSLSLTFKAPGFTIKVPTNIAKKEKSPCFNIRLNTVVKIAAGVLSATVSKFSINYQDAHVYPPIFDNVSFSFENKKTEDDSTSNKISMSDIEAKISAADIIGFNKVKNEIEKALNELVFPVFTDNEEQGTSIERPPSEIDIKSGNTQVIFCRDNRSSTRFIPLFRIVVPPIVFRLSSVDQVNCVSLDLNPYINYFNDATGNYDNIIEPFDLHLIATVTESTFLFKLESEEIVNINLPLYAMNNYMKIWEEIKSNIEKSQICNDYPSFWIKNQLLNDVQFTIKSKNPGEDDMILFLSNDQAIPIYNADLSSQVLITTENSVIPIIPSTLVFPLMVSESICVAKRPYKGGMLVEVGPPCELENNLPVKISVFHQKEKNGPFHCSKTLSENDRYPLLLSHNENLIFASDKSSNKHIIITFTPESHGNLPFTINYAGRIIYVVRTVENEAVTGRRLFHIVPNVSIISNLPLPLQILLPDKTMLNVQSNTDTPLLYVDPTQKKVQIGVSLDGMEFYKWNVITNSDETQMFNIKYPLTNSNVYLAAKVDRENEPFVKITVFVPAVIFNTTKRATTLKVITKKQKGEEIRIEPSMFCFCSPLSYLDNEECSASFKCDGGLYSDPLDLLSTANGILYTKTEDKRLTIPLRYDIMKRGLSKIVTLSEVLNVKNTLPFKIKLQPILEIPKEYGNESESIGLAAKIDVIGQKIEIEPNTEIPIQKMSTSGSFVFTMDGYVTTPSLCLTMKQRTVFRVQTEGKIFNIELNVYDNGCTFNATFRAAKFPTPFVITNELDVPVQSYQMIPINKFATDPQATSIFAFDEPFAYPNVHFIVDGCEKVLNISLIEDTDFVKLNETTNEKPIFVAIKLTPEGFRTIILTHEPPKQEAGFQISIPAYFGGLAISIINQNMEEICLLTIKNITIDFNRSNKGNCIKGKIIEISFDDQHPMAVVESALSGKTFTSTPFLTFDAIMPPNTPLFSSFEYIRICLQKMNIELDHAFVADVYHAFDRVFGTIQRRIEPLKPSKLTSTDGNQKKISIGYLEITPMIITASFKTSSSRPIETEKLPYMSIIPSISGVFNTPGLIIAQMTDTLGNVVSKISDDIKTALFNQAIEMLGFGGRIITSFGVKNTIAEALGIKLHNEMTTDITEFSQFLTSEFDNRSQTFGSFSNEKMLFLKRRMETFQVRKSQIVTSLIDTQSYKGLMFKSMSGAGFGTGVFGVVIEEMTEKRKDEASKFSLNKFKRKRIPRTYPWNIIQTYDKMSAKIQTTLQQSFKDQPRIRLIIRPNEKVYVCVTDKYLAVANTEKGTMVTAQILTAEVEFHEKKVVVTAPKGKFDITCQSEKEAMILFLFINSQKRYLGLFHFSVI